MKELKIKLPHLDIAAKIWGDESGIPVIACHGWLDNAASFDLVAPHLEGIYLIALDMAGHGRSEHRPKGSYYHLWEYSLDVIAIADYLGLDTFNLLGHSMGGSVCLFVAGTVPERVNKIISIESLGPGNHEAIKSPKRLRGSVLDIDERPTKKVRSYESIADAVISRAKGINSMLTLSEQAAQIIVERGLTENDQGKYSWRNDPRIRVRSPVQFTDDQVNAFLKNITATTRVILGEQGFHAFNPEHFTDRLRFIENAEITTFPGGHHLHIESTYKPVADYVRSFFTEASTR